MPLARACYSSSLLTPSPSWPPSMSDGLESSPTVDLSPKTITVTAATRPWKFQWSSQWEDEPGEIRNPIVAVNMRTEMRNCFLSPGFRMNNAQEPTNPKTVFVQAQRRLNEKLAIISLVAWAVSTQLPTTLGEGTSHVPV